MMDIELSWFSSLCALDPEAGGRREQLVRALRQGLLEGRLRPGARLPSSRDVARTLGVSRVTVEAAYAQLEAEGYLHRHVGRGSFVRDVSAAAPLPGRQAKALASVPLRLSRRGGQMQAGGGCQDPLLPLPFAAGSPDLRAFPHALWRQILQRQARQFPQSMGYGDPQGLLRLREAIAGYLAASRGVRCDAGQVLVLSSSQQALQLCAQMLLDEGDPVWMEDPGYRGARVAFEAAGASVVPVPVDAEGMAFSAAMPPPRLAYVTPSHQYPLGVSMSLQRRLALLERAQQEGFWLLEDDYDSEFHYDGRPMPALQGLRAEAPVVYVGTFSKVLYPSLRLAYMVLPKAFVEAFVTARTGLDGHPAQLMQAVVADFIEQGHFTAHLRLMRRLYAQRREVLLEALQPMKGWLSPMDSPCGLQLTVRLSDGDEPTWTRAAARLGVQTPSLSSLHAGPSRQAGWLLGYAALLPDEIRQAAARLGTLGGLRGA